MLDQDWDCHLRQLESAQRVLAPMPCETLFAHLEEGRGLITARIVYRHRERSEPLGLSDEVLGVLSARGVANDIGHYRARILQYSGGGLELLRIAPGNRHRMSAPCEAARDGCPQAARRAHAHNQYARPRRFSQLRIHDYLQSGASSTTLRDHVPAASTSFPRSSRYGYLPNPRLSNG